MSTIRIGRDGGRRSAIGAFVRKQALSTYFALAFAISWGGILLVAGGPGGIPGTTERFTRMLPTAVLAMLAGPSISGVLMTRLVQGHAGVRALRARLFRWRVGTRWFAVALLAAPTTAIVLLLALSPVSQAFVPGIVATDEKVARVLFGLAVALGAGFFEELGWTGFAVPELRRRHGVMATGLILGVLWGAWHLLAGLWGSGTPSGTLALGRFLPSVLSAFGVLPAFRILMVWVYERTGSLLVAMLMHLSLTASALILDPVVTGEPLIIYIALFAAALWTIVAAVAASDRSRAVVRPRPSASRPAAPGRPDVEGHVSPGFEAVRDAFEENFTKRRELGGACCVYMRGEKVVDLWGGVRDKATGEPWERDTMVLVWSATKGLAAMTLAVAHSRGWLDYEERVCTYWPEFAMNGKEAITVRQLLAHQAGLFAFDEPVGRAVVADLDRLAVVLARQTPAWKPGTRQAYHALTLGFYEGELLRRIDPQHRSLGRFFQEEIASPLGLDFYIRLPESIPNASLATLTRPSTVAILRGFPLRFVFTAYNRGSNIHRALVVNPGTEIVRDARRIYARDLEVPSGGGVGTARAMARAYGVFANGGRELGLRAETLQALAAPAIPAEHGFYDECMKSDARYSLGFMKTGPTWPFGSEGSYGFPGSGGSLGFADPMMGIGYAYVTSQMGAILTGDPRDLMLRRALYSTLPHPPADHDDTVSPAPSLAPTRQPVEPA